MKRMEARQHWTLFRSNEVTDLHELYGARLREALPRVRAARRAGQDPGPEDRGARALEEHALDALRDRPPVDHVQGPLQRPHPAGSRRRHPLVESLHRDHAQHRPTTRPPSAISARSSSRRTSTPDGALDHDEAARDHPHRGPRARQRHRHQLLPDRAAAKTPNLRHRPIGLGVMGLAARALPQAAIAFASPEARRVQRRGDGSHRLLRLRGAAATSPPSAAPTPATRARSGTAACSRRTRSTCSSRSAACRSKSRAAASWTGTPLRAKIAAQGMRNSNVPRHRADRDDLEHHGARRPASSRRTRTSSRSRTSRATSSC